MTVAIDELASRIGRGESATRLSSGIDTRQLARLVVCGIEALGFALLFLMLFVPSAYRPLKLLLLLPLLLALTARILIERRVSIHPQVAIGCLFFTALGAVFILRGYLAGAPGALRMATVYVVWPWINVLLISGLADEARLWRLARLLIWTTVAICVYCATFILWAAGWFPNALFLPLDQAQAIGFYDGYMEFSIRSLASLLFLVPFVTAAVIAWPRTGFAARWTLWLALASGLTIGLLSGRRALQLVLAVGLPVALIIRQALPGHLRARLALGTGRSLAGGAIAFVATLLILRQAFGMDFGQLWAVFQTGFQFSSDPVALIRASQFDALIQGWLSSPLLGSGHGAPAAVIRSVRLPWAYELSYVALLYHTGIIGVCAYGLGVAWIYALGLRIIRQGTSLAPFMVATLTGMTTFLIANATNPYLEKFDCLWTVFLPLAVVNVSLLKENSRLLPQTANGSRRVAAVSGGSDVT